MFISQTAEYALRAMARLASLPRGEGVRAADLSEEAGIPVHYLSKVLRRLVVAGLLESRKGHGGGFSLARPPGRIRFGDVLRATDFEPDPGRCAFGWGDCDPAQPCPLHPAWSRLNESLQDWAETTTLAEVLEPAPARTRRARAGSRRGHRRARSG